jgi:hypothetical protein
MVSQECPRFCLILLSGLLFQASIDKEENRDDAKINFYSSGYRHGRKSYQELTYSVIVLSSLIPNKIEEAGIDSLVIHYYCVSSWSLLGWKLDHDLNNKDGGQPSYC